METITSTALWQRCFENAEWTSPLEIAFCKRLRASFEGMRRQTTSLTGEICRSFRDLTVHDISHIDALWQSADLLTDENFDINPAEAFVLGGAFLVHDAGLALASYTSSREEIESTELWRDCAAYLLSLIHI